MTRAVAPAVRSRTGTCSQRITTSTKPWSPSASFYRHWTLAILGGVSLPSVSDEASDEPMVAATRAVGILESDLDARDMTARANTGSHRPVGPHRTDA